MKLSDFTKLLGVDHFFSQECAIENIFKILDPAVCIYRCPHRIWRECQSLPKSDEDCRIDMEAKHGRRHGGMGSSGAASGDWLNQAYFRGMLLRFFTSLY
ncbi:MAG: hypothetical protein DWQ04_27270 [Chloroflexi bacterium]|nr:MAG: hypothetical protein DWQ04_27270 [Chloroflexota bacterium]